MGLLVGVVLLGFIGIFLSLFLNGIVFRVIFFILFIFFTLGLLEHLMLIWDITYEEYWEISDNSLRGAGILFAGYFVISGSIYFTYILNKFLKLFHFSTIDKFILGLLILSNLLLPALLYIAQSNIPIE